MGVNVSEKMYNLFAQMSGLIVQEADRYLGVIPSTNVDISTDEIIALAKEINISETGLPQEKNIIERLEKIYPTLTQF